jgi:hypothetical protein
MVGMQLPDVFEVRQGNQMAATIGVGDLPRAEQVRRHLVAESATDPGEEAVPDDPAARCCSAGPARRPTAARWPSVSG